MKKKKYSSLSFLLVGFLFLSIISISIGFSAISTTLTLDGDVYFKPVDMIRITKFNENIVFNSNIIDYKNKIDSISATLDINDINGYVSYDIEITNLGEVDKVLSRIDNEIFTNNNMEYILEGFNIDDVIKANSTVNFKIVFKCIPNSNITDTRLNAKLNFIFEDYIFIPNNYTITFDSNGGVGLMDDLYVEYDEEVSLPKNLFTKENYVFKNWNTNEYGTGISYNDLSSIKNINSNNEKNITLYAIWVNKLESIRYNGPCIFNGKGVSVTGECSSGLDYINTGILPFSSDNFYKNFVLTFTIDSVDDTVFSKNIRETIFNAIYEANDSVGKYPGVLLRIENKKWLLQGSKGIGSDYATKLYFEKDELLNKEIKIIRYVDGEQIILYYVIGDSDPIVLKDISEMPNAFDTPLTFGANLLIDNITTERHAHATLSDISFEFISKENAMSLLGIEIPVEPPIIDEPPVIIEPTIINKVFKLNGPCIFNGTKTNISGDSCSLYSDTNYINTDMYLFNEENYSNDFDLSFNIDEYDSNNQEVTQVTLVNSFIERKGVKGYGFLLRKSNDNFELIIRDGNGIDKNIKLKSTDITSLRIVKINNNICYSTNGNNLKYVTNFDKFSAPFDVPVTFGSSIDSDGNVFRQITGILSNMQITVGKIDDVICDSTLK